jgi:hypothetical protein
MEADTGQLEGRWVDVMAEMTLEVPRDPRMDYDRLREFVRLAGELADALACNLAVPEDSELLAEYHAFIAVPS